jgi:hypothetical protein
VAKLAETRNVIAHNPFATTAQGDSGFLNVKKLKGDGPYELIPLRLTDLADAGSRLARILPDLLQPVSRNESQAQSAHSASSLSPAAKSSAS